MQEHAVVTETYTCHVFVRENNSFHAFTCMVSKWKLDILKWKYLLQEVLRIQGVSEHLYSRNTRIAELVSPLQLEPSLLTL